MHRWNIICEHKKVVWLLNDDIGFGGYRKIIATNVFDERFNEVELNEEPFEDLKRRQMELMNNWSTQIQITLLTYERLLKT